VRVDLDVLGFQSVRRELLRKTCEKKTTVVVCQAKPGKRRGALSNKIPWKSRSAFQCRKYVEVLALLFNRFPLSNALCLLINATNAILAELAEPHFPRPA
jgi:hypothetical protein